MLSVIIPWCDRAEIAQTLEANAAHFRASNAELVVVSCGGDADALRRACEPVAFDGMRLLQVTTAAGFNKCLALNLGVRASLGDVLFFLDADVELEAETLSLGLAAVGPGHFVTIDKVLESQPHREPNHHLKAIALVTELTDKKGRVIRLQTSRVDFEDGGRAAPGLIFVRREHFLAVGGMNAALSGWGWEDLDLVARLQMALGLTPRTAGRALHLSHGDEKRLTGGRSRDESERENHAICFRNYSEGRLLGTYHEDIRGFERCALAIPKSSC